ncbi:acyltransferase [Apiospora arundinis]
MLDGTNTLRGAIVSWTLCFNDVLDSDKLHSSLFRLLEIGDWRKVGGRLRLKDDGDLEIRVPRLFTTDRPAISFSHQSLAMNLNDHPLGKKLPVATEVASIQTGPQEFRAFAAREDAPTTLEDFLYQDVPQLSLHITSFNDATLALLHSWCLVLAGRELEVPALLGAREDPICAAADAPVEKEETFKVGEKQLTGLGMLSFGVRFASDLMWNRVVETRTIFLPKKAVAELRRQARVDLAAGDGSGDEPPFLSEGDVLTACVARAVASSLPQPRPVTVLQVLNARFRLSSLVSVSGVYIQNMALAAFTFLSPESTEGQVLAFLRKLRVMPKPSRDPSMVVCGEPDALLMPFTNWTRAEFFKTADFGPAVVRAGDINKARNNMPGTMVYHHASSMRESRAARNVIVVLGKDHNEGYWLTGMLLPPAWVQIQKQINTLSQ